MMVMKMKVMMVMMMKKMLQDESGFSALGAREWTTELETAASSMSLRPQSNRNRDLWW